jgi:diguanylate cyclase (GGDEF)-like protein/PAS domain S-box-containing protein
MSKLTHRTRILLVHADPAEIGRIKAEFERNLINLEILVANSPSQFRAMLDREEIDLVLLGGDSACLNDQDVMQTIRTARRDAPVMFMTRSGGEQAVMAWVKQSGLARLSGRVALATNEITAFDEALRICLDEICVYTGWPVGHAYRVDDANKRFVIREYRCATGPRAADFQAASNAVKYSPAAGLAGTVLRTRKPAWISDFTLAGHYWSAKHLTAFGLKGACAFPVFIGAELVAVLEFLFVPVIAPDMDFLELMTQVGMQLSRVAERERARQFLQSSEEKFAAAFRSSPDAMAIVSLTSGKYIDVNEQFLRLFGYLRHEVIGCHSEALPRWRQRRKLENLADGLRRQQRVQDLEAEILSAAGTVLQCLITAEVMRIGDVEHALAVYRDITKQVEMTAALKRSEGLLRSYFNAGFVGMAIISPENTFLQVNDAICDIFGHSITELSGMSVNNLVRPEDLPEANRLFNCIIAGEIDGYAAEQRGIRKDGNVISLSVSTECVRKDDGSIDHLVAFFQDISRRKTAELALNRSNRALRVLNECMRAIVHATSGQEMIDAVCRTITDVGGYRFAWVGYAQSDAAKTIYPVASAGYEAGYLKNFFTWNRNGQRSDPAGDAIATGQPSVVRNLAEDTLYESLRNEALERGYRSAIALPLNAGGQAFGALMIYAAEAGVFDDEEFKLLSSLADDLAFGILSLHLRARQERPGPVSREAGELYRLVYEENPSLFLTLNDQGVIQTVNRRGAERLGYCTEELVGRTFVDLTHEADKTVAKERLRNWLARPADAQSHEQRLVCRDGSVLWLNVTARVLASGTGAGDIMIVGADIGETRKNTEALAYRATHDALTGLINRGEFEERLHKLLLSARTDNTQHALCYLDLDRFRMINDSYGHAAGDELLRQISGLLQGQIRQRDTVARLGGDEFAVLMAHCPLLRAEAIARQIMAAIDGFRFAWGGRSFRLGVSIGLVPISHLSGNVREILNEADRACYSAKDRGLNRLHIVGEDATDQAHKRGELRRLDEIRRALDDSGFVLNFQAIESLQNRKEERERCEVLLRLAGTTGDLLTPEAFMPVAERYGLAVYIDKWVVNRVFELIAGARQRGGHVPQFFVNLSGHSLGSNDLLEFILAQLNSLYVPPENICFEITETAAIASLTQAARFINVLRERGCYFALDDFGSGLSSYAYLKNLPVDYLKIDGFFVKGIASDPVNLAIVRSMHEIGKALGKQTIAESVEDAESLAAVRKIGVDYAQGNHIAPQRAYAEFYRAIPANIIEFLKKG